MELKIIIYIVGAVLYFLYQKSKSEDKDITTLPPQKKKKSLFEEVMEEFKEATQQQGEIKRPILKPVVKTVFNSNKQQLTKGKDSILAEKLNKDFTEGYSAFKTFEEPIFDEGGRIAAADTLEVEELEQRNSDFEFDARKAVIYSTVLERKYF